MQKCCAGAGQADHDDGRSQRLLEDLAMRPDHLGQPQSLGKIEFDRPSHNESAQEMQMSLPLKRFEQPVQSLAIVGIAKIAQARCPDDRATGRLFGQLANRQIPPAQQVTDPVRQAERQR
jgi:hypothetical protein